MKGDSELIKQFKEHKRISDAGLLMQRKNVIECQEFYSGDYMSYRDRLRYNTGDGKKKMALVQFNKVKPYVNAVKGFMAQNRRKPSYTARIKDDKFQKMFSQYANALSDYCRENANADQVETQQDGDLLINGFGAVETAMTYGEGYLTNEPNGEIVMTRIDPMTLFWEPTARQSNLIDSMWIGYRKEMDIDSAMELLDAEEGDFDEVSDTVNADFQYDPSGGRYDRIAEVFDYTSDERTTVWVYYYQWAEIQPYWRCMNIMESLSPELQQIAMMRLNLIAESQDKEDPYSFKPEDQIWICNKEVKKQLEDFFEDRVKFFEQKRRVYFGAIISGEKVFTKFSLATQQGFTIKVKTGDFDEKKKMWVGMVQSMKEPVLYYNKALTELLFTIAVSAKGGVMYEEGTIDDIVEFESNYSKTDKAVEVAKNALMEGRIKPKRESALPTGLETIIAAADASMTDVTGIDKSFLGSSESKLETAQLQRQRVKQVMNTLACYFDAITLYQRTHARIMLDFMRIFAENNEGLMILLAGNEGKQFVTLSSQRLMAEYSVSIEEAPDTVSQREESAQILMGLGDRLFQAQDPAAKQVYAIAASYMPLNAQDQARVSEILMGPEKIDIATFQKTVGELNKQIEVLKSNAAQIDLAKKQSDIEANAAKTQKTMADIEKTNADTIKTMEDAKSVAKQTDMITPSSEVQVII